METRGAKKQELQEQISSVLSLMEEMKSSQAEQAKRHEQQQAELLDELRTSTQRQADQLDKLAQDYGGRMDTLVADQKRVEESVGALEKNLDSVKSVMQDRIGEAEDRIERLQSQQVVLASQQEELKTRFHEELLRVEAKIHAVKSTPETVATPTPLRPTAPPFVPTTTSSASEGGGARTEEEGRSSKSVRPSPFDGKSSWEAYQAQFKLLAELNHWTEQEKAAHLAISLRGPALTVLTNLPEEQRSDFSALAAALKNRFGNNHQAELNRAHLRGRTKKRDETLPELAEDIECITRLAYPEAAEAMVIVLAKDQFIDALPDEDMRLRIRQSRPPSLRQALETALELESYSLASRRAKPVREVHLERGSQQQDTGGTDLRLTCYRDLKSVWKLCNNAPSGENQDQEEGEGEEVVEALEERMVAGVVVNQATFNVTALTPPNKLAKALLQVEMTLLNLCRIRETGSSWACGAKPSYKI